MYSVLLTAMMTTGTTAPEFGGLFQRGCLGCQGCQGCSGCFGCGGCYGSCFGCCGGCTGCCGGGFLGLGLFTSRHGCGGCTGCCGGCFGCSGGCAGCFGSCYGMPIVYASGYGMDPVSFGMPGPGMAMIPSAPAMPPAAAIGETLQPAPTPPMPQAGIGEAITSANAAMVVVTLPADARLFADGQPIDQTGPVRSFRTPPLEPGKSYYYVLSMEVQRNGKTQKAEERVALEAGKVARVNFPEPPPAAAGNTAQIRVTVPQGATLAVEGQAMDTPNGVALIRTPEIPAGQEHVYQLKIELTRQGKPLTLNRDVTFRAGQEIRIVFDEPTARLTNR